MSVVSIVVIVAGVVVLALLGAAVTVVSYVTASGNKVRWSVRFMEMTKLGRWLNRRIAAWVINRYDRPSDAGHGEESGV